MARSGQARRWTCALLLGVTATGCAVRTPPPPAVVPLDSCMAEQSEIERLQQLLAEKDELIRNQQAHQQVQAKELQATTNQAAQAQVKLRRMASQPDAASTLAEVEVAMSSLKSSITTAPEQAMQSQAQRLLDAAAAAYAQDDYATTVDRATQSRELIDMVNSQRAGKSAHHLAVTFQSPIPLRARIDCKLRWSPRAGASVRSVLKKDSPVTALGYKGEWLHVQTDDGDTGWLLKTMVETRPEPP